MFWPVLAARLLVGLMFIVFGLNAFLGFIQIPPPSTEVAQRFMKVLYVDSHYLKAVKVLEILGGTLLLLNRFVSLAVVILMPIAVNILFYEIFLTGSVGPGIMLVALLSFLLLAYRRQFAPVFASNPKIE